MYPDVRLSKHQLEDVENYNGIYILICQFLILMHIQKVSSEVVFILKKFATHVASSNVSFVMHVAMNVIHSCILKYQTAELTFMDIIPLHQMSDELFSCKVNKRYPVIDLDKPSVGGGVVMCVGQASFLAPWTQFVPIYQLVARSVQMLSHIPSTMRSSLDNAVSTKWCRMTGR